MRQSGQGRDRTGDTWIFSPLLYQLSYLPVIERAAILGPVGEFSSCGHRSFNSASIACIAGPKVAAHAVGKTGGLCNSRFENFLRLSSRLPRRFSVLGQYVIRCQMIRRGSIGEAKMIRGLGQHCIIRRCFEQLLSRAQSG